VRAQPGKAILIPGSQLGERIPPGRSPRESRAIYLSFESFEKEPKISTNLIAPNIRRRKRDELPGSPERRGKAGDSSGFGNLGGQSREKEEKKRLLLK